MTTNQQLETIRLQLDQLHKDNVQKVATDAQLQSDLKLLVIGLGVLIDKFEILVQRQPIPQGQQTGTSPDFKYVIT